MTQYPLKYQLRLGREDLARMKRLAKRRRTNASALIRGLLLDADSRNEAAREPQCGECQAKVAQQ